MYIKHVKTRRTFHTIFILFSNIKRKPNDFVVKVSVSSVWDHTPIKITAIDVFAGRLQSTRIKFLNLKCNELQMQIDRDVRFSKTYKVSVL